MGISKLASTSAAITATVNGAATGYWVAIPYTTTTPTQPSVTQIKAGMDASGAIVALHGSGSMAANAASEFLLTNLIVNTSYQVYFYAEDASGNKTSIIPVPLVTNAASTTPASITYFAGGTGNANLTLTSTIVPASNNTGTGSYYVAVLVPANKIAPYGVVAFLTSAGWTIWTGGALLPYSQETLQTKTISILDGKLDVRWLIGTDVYVGYGLGDDLVAKKIYTIK